MSKSRMGPSRPVIVLGVDRSGTSIVARLVHEWGGYGGDLSILMRSDPFNPKGYWEYRPLVLLIGEVFKRVGRDFWRDGYDEAVLEASLIPDLRQPAEELVAKMASGGGPAWFWKEPWLCVQLPFWKSIWRDASYIVTVRNPYDSAVSWQKMMLPKDVQGRISIVALNLLRWQHFMLSVLRHVEGSQRVLFVSYEELVSDTHGQAARIGEFLNREAGVEGTEPGKVDLMAAAVDVSLWRNRSETSFFETEIASEDQKSLYSFLLSKVGNPSAPFDASAYPFYPGWREYMQNFSEFELFHRSAMKLFNSPWMRFITALSRPLASVQRFGRGKR